MISFAIAAWIQAFLGAAEVPALEPLLSEIVEPSRTEDTPALRYEVDKLELLRALPGYAGAHEEPLRLLIAIGPNGAMSDYTLVAVFADGDAFRMNAVLLSRSRITRKGTTRIAADALARFARGVGQSSVLTPGGDSPAELERRLADAGNPPFDFVLALYSDAGTSLFIADLRGARREAASELLEQVNGPLRALEPTYRRDGSPNGARR